MKFHNGCWLAKEEYTLFNPSQVYETIIKEHEVILYMPIKKIVTKGDTLDGMVLTMHISAPTKDAIRIQTYHHKGIRQKQPTFDLNLDPQVLQVEKNDKEINIINHHLSLTINLENGFMYYKQDGKIITKSEDKDINYIREHWTGAPYDHGQKAYMAQYLGLSVGELIYGLGERFGPIVKNGQSIEIWNKDGGTSTEQSYKNIPFYLSNKGYGVFVNDPNKVEFEIGSEFVSKCGFSVPGEVLDYMIIAGPTMKDVLVHYTDITGKPALLPQWSFGLWLSTSFTTSYDEKTVMSFIDGMLDRGIPLSVFHFDCLWMKEFHWSDFEWDSRVFPDPQGLLDRIKAKGIKICVWINPYISQQSSLFEEGMENNYFINQPNGDVWQWDMWQSGLAVVDFTNPKAYTWYQSKLERLLDMGVDCFKTDFGERIPVDVTYYDHSDPNKMHNYYTYLYNKCVFDLLERKKGKEEAVVFARSATATCQQFPVHWGGDCWSHYPAMSESLRGGLSLTASGFGYWSHDIGGFEQTSTPDVYKRWAAFGLLSSHSRLHGSSSYRVPWLYGEEAVDTVRFFTKLKLSLLPYFYSSSVKTHQTGIPMMRFMALEFEKDENTRYLDQQYMLGDSLLVAPIFNDESKAHYYLPKGKWYNYFNLEKATGGNWREEIHDYLSIPLWVKEGAIIPTNPLAKDVIQSYRDSLELLGFNLNENSHITVYEKGKAIVSIYIKDDMIISDSKVDYLLKDVICNKEYKIQKGNQKIQL